MENILKNYSVVFLFIIVLGFTYIKSVSYTSLDSQINDSSIIYQNN